MRKGWHNDSYRHALARKGVKTRSRLSLAGAVPYPGGDQATRPHTETAPRFKNFMAQPMKDAAKYAVDGEHGVSAKNPITDAIGMSYSDWLKPAGKVFDNAEQAKSTDDMLEGGVADDMPDEAFVEEQLKEGAEVEMEHTNNPDIAEEIAKDHLYETGKPLKVSSDYYKKLKNMEEEY